MGGVVCREDWGWEAASFPARPVVLPFGGVLILGQGRGWVMCGVAGRGGRGVRGGGGAPRGRLRAAPFVVRSAFTAVGWWERCVRGWCPGLGLVPWGRRRASQTCGGPRACYCVGGGAPGVGVRGSVVGPCSGHPASLRRLPRPALGRGPPRPSRVVWAGWPPPRGLPSHPCWGLRGGPLGSLGRRQVGRSVGVGGSRPGPSGPYRIFASAVQAVWLRG